MDRELTIADALAVAGIADESFRELCRLARCHHPADDVAAEDVHDDIQVEVGPLLRAEQLGYVPGPNLVWPGGQKLGLLVVRVTKLIAAFTHAVLLLQDPIHRSGRAQIATLVEQLRVDLRHCEVCVMLGIQFSDDFTALVLR